MDAIAGEGSSSPLVYTWDGEKYVYVADVGATLPRNTDGTDYAHIDASALAPKDGKYSIKVSQEYNEIVYYDEIGLLTFEHAPGYTVVNQLGRSVRNNPEEFVTISNTPTHPLLSCTDMYGNNCLDELKHYDDKWSYKDESFVNEWVLDFGDLSDHDEINLVIRGARDYAFSSGEDRYISVLNEEGEWERVYNRDTMNSPDGTPRLRSINMAGKFLSNDYRIKVGFGSVNLNYVAVDTSAQVPFTSTFHHPQSASLGFFGYSAVDRTYFWDHNYYDVSPYPRELFMDQSGNFTKYGSVLPLLESTNDQFVVMRHGDMMTLEFPYVAVEDGLERSFMLYNYALYKHAKHGDWARAVDPMPFQNMVGYPNTTYPMTQGNATYIAEWNTRVYHATNSGGGHTIYNSSAEVNVSGGGDYVGGLVGYNDKGIHRSYATGEVSGASTAGGLVGNNAGNATIVDSYARSVVSGAYVGGLAGSNDGDIFRSYATGSTEGGQIVSGGLVSYNYATIISSFANVNFNGTATFFGGLVGDNQATMRNVAWVVIDGESAIAAGTECARLNDLDFPCDTYESPTGDVASADGFKYPATHAVYGAYEEVEAWDFSEDGVWDIDPNGVSNDGWPFLRWQGLSASDPEPDPILGCTDSSATNYNPSATENNGSCTYPSSGGGGGSSSGSRSSSGSSVVQQPAQTLEGIVNQYRDLLLQAHGMGIFLPPNILRLLGIEAPKLPSRDLEFGMEGEDVRALQTLLIGQGYSIPAGATGFFANQTRSALAAYQSANGINPPAGYFGPITRAFMKAAGLTGLWW